MKLASIQRQFQRALFSEGTYAFIRKQAPLPSARRIGIYRYAYRARLREALSEDFPALRRLLKEQKFLALINLYIDKQPSRSPSLVDFGARFPAFVRKQSRALHLPSYSGDLADFEWQKVRCFF